MSLLASIVASWAHRQVDRTHSGSREGLAVEIEAKTGSSGSALAVRTQPERMQ